MHKIEPTNHHTHHDSPLAKAAGRVRHLSLAAKLSADKVVLDELMDGLIEMVREMERVRGEMHKPHGRKES